MSPREDKDLIGLIVPLDLSGSEFQASVALAVLSATANGIAIFMIFVQLSLVTAVALFFSTFASPMVSAALAFGLYIVGG